MENILTILQIISAVVLVVLILLQQRGTGLGGAFGGAAEVYSAKRGAEKMVFTATIITSVIFIGLGILRLILT